MDRAMINKDACLAVIRSAILIWVAINALACTSTAPSPSADKAGTPRAGLDAAAASFADALGVRCDDAASASGCILGNLDAGDYYDVELSPSCGANGLFAGVAAADSDLLDTLPVTGSNVQTNATLGQGQFVCVQAIARAGRQPAYYYVAAMSPEGGHPCEQRELCECYGMRPVDFGAQVRSGIACTVDTTGHVQGDCGRGWINAKSLERSRTRHAHPRVRHLVSRPALTAD
jgi:hypothetical protein